MNILVICKHCYSLGKLSKSIFKLGMLAYTYHSVTQVAKEERLQRLLPHGQCWLPTKTQFQINK